MSNHDNPQYVAELLEYMERRGKAGLSRRELLALTVGATGFAALTRANRGFAAPLGAFGAAVAFSAGTAALPRRVY